jgi:hypothetical protein
MATYQKPEPQREPVQVITAATADGEVNEG